MKEEKDILAQIDHNDGMTVPEGYFADFAARMAASLPETPYEKSAKAPDFVAPNTFWQKVRPYVYMAAMFAGVWCMLKMFTVFTNNPSQQFAPSPTLSAALGNEVFVSDYLIDDVDQWDLIDELMEDGVDVHSLSSMLDEADDTEESEQSIEI